MVVCILREHFARPQLVRHLLRAEHPDEVARRNHGVNVRGRDGQVISLQSQNHAVVILFQAAIAYGFSGKGRAFFHGNRVGIQIRGFRLVRHVFAQGHLFRLLQSAQAGDMETALALYETIPGYQDADSKRRAYAYDAAETALAQGDLSRAVALFTQAGDYRDASVRAQATADRYYADAYAAAVEAMEKKDYKAAADILAPLAKENVPEAYENLPGVYQEACYRCANDLYADKQPFEALKYYREIPDYKDVSTKRLKKTVYQVMGKWETAKGVKMEFREDGFCVIDGKEAFYTVPSAFAIHIGDSPDTAVYTYNIISHGDGKLTLLQVKQNVYYRMTRAEE